MKAQLAAQQDLAEAIEEEWNLLTEKAGGTQWHISPAQLITFDFVDYQELGELPFTEEAILNVARIHMDKLNEEIMMLFTATQNLSDNINRYFLVEKRSTAINSGEKAIQDSIEIQKTLQADIQQSKDEESV
jgi:galactokinase/mevalonate kinase-like predicted kinase